MAISLVLKEMSAQMEMLEVNNGGLYPGLSALGDGVEMGTESYTRRFLSLASSTIGTLPLINLMPHIFLTAHPLSLSHSSLHYSLILH